MVGHMTISEGAPFKKVKGGKSLDVYTCQVYFIQCHKCFAVNENSGKTGHNITSYSPQTMGIDGFYINLSS